MLKKYYLLALLHCSTHLAWAGPPDQIALRLVDKAIQHKNFQATFTYQIQSDQEVPLEEKLGGSITMQGHQYSLSIGGQEVVSDGTTVWSYLPDANEVRVNAYDPEQGASMPWLLLTNYRQDYEFHDLRGAQKIDKQRCNLVTLVAKDPKNTLQQVVIAIEWDTYHIRRLEVLDSDQQWHRFSVTKFKTDLALEDSFFKFIPENYAGIEVIDMR